MLEPHAYSDETPTLSVSLKSVRLLKSGAFSDTTSNVNPESVLKSAPAKYLRRSDLSILRAIAQSKPSYGGTFSLDSSEGATVLADILKTGRAR